MNLRSVVHLTNWGDSINHLQKTEVQINLTVILSLSEQP